MPSLADDLNALHKGDAFCLCGSGKSYANCCQAYHIGTHFPEEAEQLMRSRYVAFALRLEEYLLKTWDSQSRPAQIEFENGLSWKKLTILKCQKGRSKDKKGWVTFAAQYQIGFESHQMIEKSEFQRDKNGRWVYLTGEFE
ncbi:MAG: YchJ family metal-binding protein [Thiomicrorhabdus chilensis]|uniref:YchJ family protein n=1 Tax=Thiomicrorhabdus chilensis TaxID=63656 RepID=UPI00299D1B3D|nr:YchJ family metal-binding protein [Thiomicrorhabdus chilensis]MDX1348176.1 YchJ family metal-binding protein [Thiomicrorhabdus chilensis]